MPFIIVDGYNMIRRVPRFLRAERKSLEEGREVLLMALEDYGAVTGDRITVVFDGGGRPFLESGELPLRDSFAGIDIVFSKRGQLADMEILKIVRESKAAARHGDFQDLIVISDDIQLGDEVRAFGAFVLSPEKLDIAMTGKRRLSY